MIRVDINLVPYGYQPDELVGTVIIGNDGSSGDKEIGNYIVTAQTHDPSSQGRARLVDPVGTLHGWFGGFPRQSKNVLFLLRDALNAVIPDTHEPSNSAKVREFMQAMGQPMAPSPAGTVSTDVEVLRYNLIEEELGELATAQANHDVVGIADALADLLYVVYGAAHTYGIPIDTIFDEVHRSNMTKLENGKPVMREDGKVIKGPSYEPPVLEPLLGVG